jgi:hypothetical protein
MKHILNNLSEQEKNAIREQHTGGMNVVTENFHKLLGSKLGDSKPLTEQSPMFANAASALTGQSKPAPQKSTMMSAKVKELVGFLKNNGYTPSEISQAQEVIKNSPVSPTMQKPAIMGVPQKPGVKPTGPGVPQKPGVKPTGPGVPQKPGMKPTTKVPQQLTPQQKQQKMLQLKQQKQQNRTQ